jgi:DNA-binding XRE family transcriptional regulator
MSAKIIPLRPKIRRRKPRRPRGPWQRRRYEFYRAYARRLRFVRHRLGITEQSAADAFGVTVRTYQSYEAGKPPRDGSLGYLDFAHAFGLDFAWLLGWKGAVPPRFRLRVV